MSGRYADIQMGEILVLDPRADTCRPMCLFLSKSKFMDSYVVFVENDGSGLYHKYGCDDFAQTSFWAYSRKLAEANGYKPCPRCFG